MFPNSLPYQSGRLTSGCTD